MKKKGQITIVIIIGSILLFLMAGTIFLLKTISSEKLSSEQEMIPGFSQSSLNLFVEKCLEKTAKKAVKFVSQQGGYNYVPEPNLNAILVKLPYYFDLGQNNFPTKEIIKEEMEKKLLS